MERCRAHDQGLDQGRSRPIDRNAGITCGQRQRDRRGVGEEAADAPAPVGLVLSGERLDLELVGPDVELERERHVAVSVVQRGADVGGRG